MNIKLPWIKRRLFIIAILVALTKNVEAANKSGIKAVILYTYDESVSGSSVVTMEVDSSTFMNVIKDSQTNVIDAKPLRFSQGNGFFDLLEGDSSAFSFATTSGMADCDCKCSKRPTTTVRTTTPRPTTTRADPCGGKGREPFCCENGANNPDCCINGGKGLFCCTNGQNNPTCSVPTTTTPRPATTRADPCGGKGREPFCCENGANNPDCCINGGKGLFCCTNGQNNPTCSVPTTPATTRRTSTPAPTYLPPTTLPPLITQKTTVRNDPCPQGGIGKFCCKNGANNPDCCLNNGRGLHCCLNGANNPDCCANNGSGPFCCKNNAQNQDCCINNGKGKYCCTTGYDNPTCSPPITTLRPSTTQRATTTRTTRPPIFISKKPVFQGPSYLPVARVTTERPSTTTQTYTYGTHPTYRYTFGFTNAYWSHAPYVTRNFTTRVPSTTAKYEYRQPINGINYNGADDYNSL